MEDLPNGLRRLNFLQPAEVQLEFVKCCGSQNWARQMSEQVPFRSLGEFLEVADQTWWSLPPADWLEAFRSHPKIGEQKTATQTSEESLSWSRKEQAGVSEASTEIRKLLADLNRRYEEKFGFIYIVCATGKSSEELLANLQQRLAHDAKTELPIAAREQAEITRLRLNKLVKAWNHKTQ